VLHVDNAGLLQEKIPGSRRVLFEQTGHVPMVEKPKETAQNFRNFLKEVATTAPNISFEGGGPKAARPSTLR
jgi:hypothetical protein